MFTNRRISPLSSQTRSLSPGNCPLSDSIMDWMSEAVASTSFFPPVNGRRGVGMRTFTMWSLPLVLAQVERLLELRQARGNTRRPGDGVYHGLLGFEACARVGGGVQAPAALGGGLERVIAVGGIADRQRLGDGVGLHRLEKITALLLGRRDGGAAFGLRPMDLGGQAIDQAQLVKLVEPFPDFREQGAGGHRN